MICLKNSYVEKQNTYNVEKRNQHTSYEAENINVDNSLSKPLKIYIENEYEYYFNNT